MKLNHLRIKGLTAIVTGPPKGSLSTSAWAILLKNGRFLLDGESVPLIDGDWIEARQNDPLP